MIFNDCPITGLRVITSKKWNNLSFSSDYSVSYKIIEKNILLGEAVGSADLEGLKKSLKFALKIINENFEDKPFIYIEDFSKVLSPTTEARKYYIEFMKSLKNMKALIYYDVNPLLRLSIKLAQKLTFVKFNVFVSKNYSDAVNFAINTLYPENGQKTNKTKGHDQKTYPEADLNFENFSIHFEIIDDNILHIIPKGIFKKEYLGPVFTLQDRYIKENLQDKVGKYYYVIDLSEASITKKSRVTYIRKIQSFYDRFPFISYIIYGGSRSLNVAVIFGRPFVNFNVKKVSNLKEVIEFKKNKKQKKDKVKFFKNTQKRSEETQGYIDEFISFLGKLDWESNNNYKNFKKDTSHPFYQVYDAITLIKSDLDELHLERKKNEEERTVLQHKLQQSLKLETMGKLAGSVAHDLNNVLSGIVSYPDIILKELPSNKENEKAEKYVKRMKTSGQKAADIVQDLLTLSRSGIVNFDIVNFNSIINDYLKSPELKKLQYLKPKVSIKCKLEKNLNNMSASPIHLTKTIMNLVTNAFEAISEKGKIIISTTNKTFNNVSFKGYNRNADGDFIELKISDTGSGISKQDLPKIFEPFYSKKVMGRSGTGLGMLVIKGTIDDHNGYILINSKEGKGSEFLLYFPVKEEQANKKFIQKIDNYTGKGESILIIDDDEDQRIIAYKILKGLYYSVKTIPSGEEAIKYLKQNTVDLIVLDMIMEPGISGLETFKKIKEINPDQKAIIVSGFSATDHVFKAQKLGAGKYIRKPYTIEDIGLAAYNELNKK